jgi:hypothetical protein
MNENLPNSPTDNATPLDEELVAYLDGELEAESSRRIEALLASDAAIRRRLQSLERTWDLLDELDAAPLGEPFTQTTLEMVALAARKDAEQDRTEAPRRRRRLWITLGVALMAAAAAGFLIVALYDPDRQLLRDLPLLDDLDEYRQIGSIEFLHRLRDEGLFSKEATDAPKGPTADDEGMSARRQQIAGMSLDKKEQLVRADERLAALAPAEQRRLRRLCEDLQNAADADRLRAIMHAYYEWLKPLPSLTWADLADGDLDDRIAAVKRQLQEEQQREGGWRPTAKDMAALRAWMDGCAPLHEADYLKALQNDDQRKQFAKANKSFQRQMIAGYLWWRWQAPNPTPDKLPPLMTEDDMARLRDALSPTARKKLEGKTPAEQWAMVAASVQGFRRAFEERRPRAPLSTYDDQKLAEFFEKELDNKDRDRLLSLPGEEMQWELQRMFWMRTRPPEGPGRRNRWPGDFERPGAGRPGSPPRRPATEAK